MHSINRIATVSYSASQMYQLVDAVEDYPQFLPWCKASHVLSRDEDEVRAMLTLSAGGFSKSFTTSNLLQKDKMIEIRLVEGPFKHLEGFWRFNHTSDQSCQVVLDLEFEFSSRLLTFAFEPVFHQVTSTLVDAFCKRAEDVYGGRQVNQR